MSEAKLNELISYWGQLKKMTQAEERTAYPSSYDQGFWRGREYAIDQFIKTLEQLRYGE